MTANILTMGLSVVLLEGMVRLLVRRTPDGVFVRAVELRPTWPELVARSRHVHAQVNVSGVWDTSYFVYDRELGWTVGSSRRSRDGLYFSSVEGVRSASPGVRLAGEARRDIVALIGDSNAFSLEVAFGESWGNYLQQALGSRAHVLNFGVDGYGIDQMLLRYERDVRPWKPKVVVVGFIQHDLVRTMAVYPFVGLDWPGYVVKPRFVLEGGEPRLLNSPLPTPDEVFSERRLDDLPFVASDLTIRRDEWRFRFDHLPLLIRLFSSRFTPRPVVPTTAQLSGVDGWDAATRLNGRLMSLLVSAIENDGATPLFVFLPDDDGDAELARRTLGQVSVTRVDPTPCLAEIPALQRRVPSGHHYAGPGNHALAACTSPAILAALRARAH
jgi:hypothetical protein